jgi:hypothetical protein
MAKEPKSAKEVLSNLSKGKGTDPVMGLRFKGSKKALIDKKTKRLDRPSLEDHPILTDKEKTKIKTEFNKYKIDPNKPAEDKSKPISDPARFKNLKFGKVYGGTTRKAKYTA